MDRLSRERRARLAAERILEQKKRELFAANQQLSQHARNLSDQVVQQRRGLERANAAAAVAQRRLWTALETFRDGFALFDSDLRLVLANRAYLSAFGPGAGVGAGTTYDDILRIAARSGIVDLAGADPDDWHHMMMARILSDRIEAQVIRLSIGRHIRLVERRTEDGDLVSQALDITEAMAREAELEDARLKAEAATRAKSAFLANMTHELRTPMNGVVGMAELLAEGELTDEQRTFVDTIRSSGEALLAIINDILDFSKADAQRMRLFPEPFDLERCLQEVMRLVQPIAKDKALRLIVDYDAALPQVFVADPGRIRQVLMNLVGNAVKFTAAGYVLARVTGTQAGQGTYRLQITVEDTGIGIAPEHRELIFGEFNQVQDQSNRAFEGTGLGLAISRQLIAMMGGRIWVDSEPGRGSVFGIDLTLEVPAGAEEVPAPTLQGTAWVRIDHPVERAVIERQLSATGLRIADAAEAATADCPSGTIVRVIDDATLADGDADIVPKPGVLMIVLSDRIDHGDADRLPPGALVLRKPALTRDIRDILADRAAAPGIGEEHSADGALRQMRILAAEDNRTNQLVFRKMVKEFDIDLTFADNGVEAVDLWDRTRPDLIFMDISMPEMDGREATRTIRRREEAQQRPRVPIVAVTAHAMKGDEEEILAAGLDHYLTKPLRKAAIAEQIQRFQPETARPAIPAPPAEDHTAAESSSAEAVSASMKA